MLLLEKFKKGPAGLPSLINYFGFLEEGIILNSDGSLLRSFYYYCPDLESEEDVQRHSLCAHINNIISRLGTGWMMNVDMIRVPVKKYLLDDHYQQTTLKYFERERINKFEKSGQYFDTVYALTLTYKPMVIHDNAFKKVFIEGEAAAKNQTPNMQDILAEFKGKTEEIKQDLLNAGLFVQDMSSQELKRFLQFCITGNNLDVHTPDDRCFLNHVLGAYDFKSGLTPSVDNKSIGVVSIVGYPNVSFSGMLDTLYTLPFSYRVSNRFIFLDTLDAQKALRKSLVHWHNKQFTLKQIINQVIMPGSESRYGDVESQQKANDVHEAITEAEEGSVAYGYYTSVVIVTSEDEKVNEQKINAVKEVLAKGHFPSRIENINAVEAYLGSLPGDSKANVRRPLINTMNLAHILPLSSTWKGEPYNPNPKFPKNSPALFQAVTSGSTPFNFNIHVEDLGHNIIIGVPGSGKTTLQGFMAIEFLRYKDAQVFCFDNLMAQYALSKAAGGVHYEIMGDDSGLACCPLMDIENEEEKIWAAQWLEELVTLQGVDVTPSKRAAISDALETLKSDKDKTLSNFYMNIQDTDIRTALEPFTSVKGGIMSKLLDSPVDNLEFGQYQVLDMEKVLKTDKRFALPLLTYFFHKIEQRLDGRPTLIQLAETWELLNHDVFAKKINEWLRQLRAKNASVSFETHSIADIMNSSLKDAILSSCPTKIFLPNPYAETQGVKPLYRSLGLNDVQINMITNATAKKHYYYTSPNGSRLIGLELSEAFLSFTGRNTKTEIDFFKSLEKEHGKLWVPQWFILSGLERAAEDWLRIKKENGLQNGERSCAQK